MKIEKINGKEATEEKMQLLSYSNKNCNLNIYYIK